jgi:hypothetical protein
MHSLFGEKDFAVSRGTGKCPQALKIAGGFDVGSAGNVQNQAEFRKIP